MIPQWDLIPREILLIIFDYVRQEGCRAPRSLAQCALTCRSWRAPAQQVYFKSIHVFGRRDLMKAKHVLTRRPNDDDDDNDFSLGMLVKEIHYAFDYKTFEEDIQLIDTLFPRLERSYYELYSVAEPFQVLTAILAGRFKSLREVPTFENFDACEERNYEPFPIELLFRSQRRLCLYKSRYDELRKQCVQLIRERNRKNVY